MTYFRVSYKAGKGEGGLKECTTLQDALGYKPPLKFTHPIYIERVRVKPKSIIRQRLYRWGLESKEWKEV